MLRNSWTRSYFTPAHTFTHPLTLTFVVIQFHLSRNKLSSTICNNFGITLSAKNLSRVSTRYLITKVRSSERLQSATTTLRMIKSLNGILLPLRPNNTKRVLTFWNICSAMTKPLKHLLTWLTFLRLMFTLENRLKCFHFMDFKKKSCCYHTPNLRSSVRPRPRCWRKRYR